MTENAVTYMRMYVSRSLRSEKDMATHSSILAGESQEQRSLVGCRLWSCTESDTTEAA